MSRDRQPRRKGIVIVAMNRPGINCLLAPPLQKAEFATLAGFAGKGEKGIQGQGESSIIVGFRFCLDPWTVRIEDPLEFS